LQKKKSIHISSPRTAELSDFSVFTENYSPSGDEYLLENNTSFLTDSYKPLKKKNMDKRKKNFANF
jgi:hypothetical protein